MQKPIRPAEQHGQHGAADRCTRGADANQMRMEGKTGGIDRQASGQGGIDARFVLDLSAEIVASRSASSTDAWPG